MRARSSLCGVDGVLVGVRETQPRKAVIHTHLGAKARRQRSAHSHTDLAARPHFRKRTGKHPIEWHDATGKWGRHRNRICRHRSRRWRRIVATVARPGSTLWSVPILERLAEARDAERAPVTTVRAHAPRFGGSSLFYLSARGNANDIYRFANGMSSETWKGIEGTLSEPPAIDDSSRA